ncbi:glycoside hydrolase family 3 N-terminal domain-containing protein [Halosimplex aquaticum]|uniref:Glycoside hydrolase family 3 N-terminal domain-containing protein n=1 Tax=Halosimplex aquaticum TaxID=3026162 RepID=A0ABD5YEC3_9EURY|nr:glycoside hydrolase family 3 N-terminal domain-containing protein [Halosimplex aquaticum]
MTLEEKAAQLGSVSPSRNVADEAENEGDGGTPMIEDGELNREAAEELLAEGIGHLTRIGGEGSLPPERAAEITNELQTFLTEETRLGIPAIPHEECLSGYMGPEGTTFPQGIGMASTWDPDLMEAVTDTIGDQLEAIGTAHALSPVLDVARDLRWGRVEETFGEDPYLVAQLATAYVSGLQGDSPADGISATLKHFVGHGVGAGGKNRSSVDVSERQLREVHMFPFEAAIQEADAESVMNAYHDIDGIPCAKDERLLTDVLRGEWGFDGHVVSDYFSVDFLKEEHGVAATQREAGVAAVEAGIDVELPNTDCYEYLPEAVRRGELAEETLDESVRRVLRAKFEKGLFEDPTVDVDAATDPYEDEFAADLAREAARDSLVVLKNESDLLPLDGADSVAVVGPKADDKKGMLGDYAYAAHYPEEEYEFEADTPLAAIENRVDADVSYAQGCTATGNSTDEIGRAVEAAEDADVALAFVGARSAVDFSDAEGDKREKPMVPTSGEGCDVTDLGLPGVQKRLVERVQETDTPVVVVLVSGKPHAIPEIDEGAEAVVQAWLPGEEAGNAVVDVVFDGHDSGGHLPVSMPKSVGQLPVHYSRKPNTFSEDYVYDDAQPVYPFGHGLSYAEFEFSDLDVSDVEIGPSDTVTASVTVENTADRPGSDVVQLYVSAENPDQARPVQELKGFRRVELDGGESARVSFELGASQLAYHDRSMTLAVEEGEYELRVAHSATDVAETATVSVTESKPVPRTARRYVTETTVDEA